jgi:hypothetical protein
MLEIVEPTMGSLPTGLGVVARAPGSKSVREAEPSQRSTQRPWWVDSYIKKWTAERAALRVNGVHAVANDIEVRLTPGDQRTDADIAAAATRALQWDAGVPHNTVKVAVSKGWVTLEGDVECQFQRRSAERAVRALAGVRGVILGGASGSRAVRLVGTRRYQRRQQHCHHALIRVRA